MSTLSSVFDPLGLVAPFILAGKQILQEKFSGPTVRRCWATSITTPKDSMFSLAIASRKYESRHFRTSGTTLEQNPILRISLPVLLVPKSLSTTLCGGMGHLRQPIHSVFVFIKSLLSAKDFLRNCLHTSKS